MRNKSLFAAAIGTILLAGTASYAAPEERWERGERQEQAARREIRRGEEMEREGERLERRGEWRRGEELERRGEYLERHGRQMLAQAERREHFGERWERTWR